MIDVIILYILNKQDSTIYGISKIANRLFINIKTGCGTITPALKRLENLKCVTHNEKMSDGGMLSKIFSITKEGKKLLIEKLLNFDSKNPYHIINEAKIALFCSDVLSINEYTIFKDNVSNVLELYKIKLEQKLKDSSFELNELQKSTVKITCMEVEELIKLL